MVQIQTPVVRAGDGDALRGNGVEDLLAVAAGVPGPDISAE
jgi:hypothetical protein